MYPTYRIRKDMLEMSEKKFLYETHMHTFESSFCGVAKAKEHVRIYKDRGYAE